MASPWEKYGGAPAATSGPILGAPKPVDPYKAEDQQLQRDAAARADAAARRAAAAAERTATAAERPTLKAGYMWGPDGKTAVPIPGIPNEASDPKASEGEKKAAFLTTNLVSSAKLLADAVKADPSAAAPTWTGKIAGVFGQDVKNSVLDPQRQVVEDSQLAILDAALTLGTGAAYNKEQLEGYRQSYFPQIGDAPEAIEAKKIRLKAAMAAARISAGSAAPQIDQAIAALGLADEGEANTAPDGERIYQPGAAQGVELSNGGTQTVDDPILAGVNAKVNGLLKSGASGTQIANYLKERGIPASAVNLQQVLRFRRENPNYKGDYSVNIDDKEVPMSGFRSRIADAANSPLSAGVVAAADTLTGGRLDNLVGAAGGNAELANTGVEMLRNANPMSSLAGDVAGGAALYGIGGGALAAVGRGAPAATGALAGRAVAGDAALGAYVGSGQGGTDLFSSGNALAGAVGGAAGGIVGRGAINTLGRTLSPSGGQLAPAYAEGVQPTVGQRVGGVVGRAEEAFASVPLVGGIQRSARNGAVQQWQAGAFNKALREVGTTLPKNVQSGVQAQAFMQRTFNKAYDQARSGLTFRQDAQFNTEFATLVKDEVAALGADGQRIFKTFVDRGSNMLKARGGTLAGQDYKNLVSRIEAKARGLRKSPSGDTELADALEGLSLTLDKAARRHSTPEAVKALDAADRGYVMAVLIEEAGRKAGTEMGEFTGKQLEGAIRSNSGRRSRQALRGEAPLQEYAAAGVRLGDTVPDSGTPERLAMMGGMGAVATFLDPKLLVPWAADTLMNLPGGKQAMNLLMAPNRKGLDPARQKLMERANLGGLLAAPAAQGFTGP